MAGRICGSKLVEEVIATETNLEVISLRIFKSMGTDEITREQGSEKGEAALAPTPRTPAIQWDHKPQEVRDMRFRHRCTSSPTSVPGLGQTPTKALPLWRLERAVLRQKEKQGVGRSQKKMLEGGSGLLGGLPATRKVRFANTEGTVTAYEGPSRGVGSGAEWRNRACGGVGR